MAYPHVEEDGPRHVRDHNGVIWRVVRDGGMATCADYAGIYSVGIVWLADNYGPLVDVERDL